MVTLQILVLPFLVRVRVPQHEKRFCLVRTKSLFRLYKLAVRWPELSLLCFPGVVPRLFQLIQELVKIRQEDLATFLNL